MELQLRLEKLTSRETSFFAVVLFLSKLGSNKNFNQKFIVNTAPIYSAKLNPLLKAFYKHLFEYFN